MTFSAVFESIVENCASETKSKPLIFEIRGDGILPRFLLDKPVQRSKIGTYFLKFHRLYLGDSQTIQVQLRNDGIVSSLVKVEVASNPDEAFTVSGTDHYVPIKPQESQTLVVNFCPRSVQKYEAELRFNAVDNPYEDTVVVLYGEGHSDDLVLDNVPGEADNEVQFGGCGVGDVKRVTFNIRNMGTDMYRIGWNNAGDFSFNAPYLHLKPQDNRSVTLSLNAKQAMEINQTKIVGKVTRIRYSSPSDDPAKPAKRVENPSEPAYIELPGQCQDIILLVSAVVDNSAFECDQKDLHFKDTFMMQSRIHKFNLRNPGKIPLKFDFQFIGSDNSPLNAEQLASIPFAVSPQSGSIESGESQQIAVAFSPMDDETYSYRLQCLIPSLSATVKPFNISLMARGVRPLCHFDLQESNYLIAKQEGEFGNQNTSQLGHAGSGTASLIASLPKSTKVIEFNSCGIFTKNYKRFYIFNPSNYGYKFQWNSEATGTNASMFTCNTPTGFLNAGKRCEISFEYNPESGKTMETLWRFTIPEHKVSVPFLLVGTVNEPNVTFDSVGLDFKSVLLGHQVKQTLHLRNNEPVSFNYQIDMNPVVYSGSKDGFRLMSTAGVIGAKSVVDIDVIFSPRDEKIYDLSFKCIVPRKTAPLVVNFKGEGYSIHDQLFVQTAAGTFDEIQPGAGKKKIDFDQIFLQEKRTRDIMIANSGKVNFDYEWTIEGKHATHLTIDQPRGTVAIGESANCTLSFFSNKNVILRDAVLKLSISHGNSYEFQVLGIARQPKLKLSSNSHNFGPCPLSAGPAHTVIELTNEDLREYEFEVASFSTSAFRVTCDKNIVMAGETAKISIEFQPKEAQRYSEIISIDFANNFPPMTIRLEGEGAPFKVEPLSQDMQELSLGAISVGSSITKTVKLINRGLLTEKFQLGTQQNRKSLKLLNVNMRHSAGEQVVLKPRGILSIEIEFAPKTRMCPFSETIYIQTETEVLPVFTIQGESLGIEIKLDTNIINFGSCVIKSSATRRLLMFNYGDLSAHYCWHKEQFGHDFTIEPSEGFILPGSEVAFEIKFFPKEVRSDIKLENIKCSIEGESPLFINILGTAAPLPSALEVLRFNTPVRQQEQKVVTVTNKTNTLWQIKPIIDNLLWKGPEFLEVEANQSKSYDIIFSPLQMSKECEGTLFFPLADGTGLLYKLAGTVEKPAAESTVTKDVPSKVNHIEPVQVHNWLSKPQRFRVYVELQKSEPTVTFKGPEIVDVPALSTRECKFQLYSYKEGMVNAKVTFKNETSQEFLFHLFTFKVLPPSVLATVEIETPARQLTCKEITLSNPLQSPVTLNCNGNNSEINVPHTVTIPPKSDGTVPIEFLPLFPKESMARVTFTSQELGSYLYDLKLIAQQPLPERVIQMRAPLGSAHIQTLHFISYVKSRTEYTVKIDHPDFTTEKTIMAPLALNNSGVEVQLDLVFEPSKIGEFQTTLVISSPVGGDYAFPLTCSCTPPKPQGPFMVKVGAPTIMFKNVTNSTVAFSFVIDNPSFTVKSAETLGPKKTAPIMIAFKANSPKTQKTARMTVTHPNGITWVYYLKAQ